MRKDYIDLNRSFVPMQIDSSFDEDEYESLISYGVFGTKKWNDLFQLHRVIILAEAGAGKTEEIYAATLRLRKKEHRAFFFRLEHLAADFESSFEIGDSCEFEEWLKSDEDGWFFLDSVDEARLVGPKQFEMAIRKFGQKIARKKQKSHVYITSRITEWRPQSDLSLIQQRVPFSNQEEDTEFETEPQIFSLCPLDWDQIKTFSQAFKTHNPGQFLETIKDSDTETFAKRPQDLIDLIHFWNNHGMIASHLTMHEENISSKLKESDPDRNDLLSMENSVYGAERIAAAVTFSGKNRILVPEKNPDRIITSMAVDVQDVLTDWKPEQIRALLQRPIFDKAIYGTVRFHHRSIREFLTAKWLSGLLKSGKSGRAIEALFFKVSHGVPVIIRSMRPILAWLILFDDKIRDKTFQSIPELLIQGGDPSCLPIEIRKRVLEKLCENDSETQETGFSYDYLGIKRFAHRDLGTTVKKLLNHYSDKTASCNLLLSIVEHGKIHECVEKSIEIAMDDSQEVHTCMNGINVIESVGSDEQKRRFVKNVLTNTPLKSKSLLGKLILSFSPEFIDLQKILALIKDIKVGKENTKHGILQGSLEDFSQYQCPLNSILEWIHGILDLINLSFSNTNTCTFSSDYIWLLPNVSIAAERLIRKKHTDAFDKRVLETVCLLQIIHHDVDIHFDHNLKDAIPQWSEFNHTLFWFDVETTRKAEYPNKKSRLNWRHQIGGGDDNFWKFTGNDFEQFVQDIKDKVDIDDQLLALSWAFLLFNENNQPIDQQKALKEAVIGNRELEETLDELLNPPSLSERTPCREEGKEWKQKREEEETKLHEQWCQRLKSNITILRDTSGAVDGKVPEEICYLMGIHSHRRDKHTTANQSNWERLIPEFGQEIAEAYRGYCTDFWRKYTPKMRSENLDDPYTTSAALSAGKCGIEIEVKNNPKCLEFLSEKEADLACKYAIHESDKFPVWLGKLYSISPETVEEALSEEIEWEFSDKDNRYFPYVLSKILRSLEWIRPKISRQILNFFKKYNPPHDNTERHALSVVLSDPELDRAFFVSIARRKIDESKSLPQKALWLASWMNVAAETAILRLGSTLEQYSESNATELAMRFMVHLLSKEPENRLRSDYRDFQRPDCLSQLIKMMDTYIPPSRDTRSTKKGVHPRFLVFDAEYSRDQLFLLLRDMPGKGAYHALLNLEKSHPNKRVRKYYKEHAQRRAELDAEPDPWLPKDIDLFSKEAEKPPRSHRELYDLTISRLLDLKADLEEGDTSLANMLHQIKEETLYRNYIGGWLRDHEKDKYIVSQEEELADSTRPDIRIHNSEIDAPVPIELKIVDNNWTGKQLIERLENQLCGQYLRDFRSNCGIFLLIYRGQKKTWNHPANNKIKLNFQELIKLLEKESLKIQEKDHRVESIQIIGIDITKRG